MKKRLFIALDISDEVRQAAAEHMVRLAERFPHVSIKWERPEKFHITVKFLGMTYESLFGPIFDLVNRSAAKTREFDIEIAGSGAFPTASRPRVLWLGINQPTGDMADLARRVELQCAELGFEAEKREFKPHVTLARIRDPRIASDVGRAHAASQFGPIHFTCNEIVVYESHLGRGGSTYEKLHTAKFRS